MAVLPRQNRRGTLIHIFEMGSSFLIANLCKWITSKDREGFLDYGRCL
jgi:hypothetical protein